MGFTRPLTCALVWSLGCWGAFADEAPAPTKDAPNDSQVAEFKQDFLDFDLNKDDQIDAQEVRANYKGDLDPKELHQFFLDTDKDDSGTVTLQEYIDYAITLS